MDTREVLCSNASASLITMGAALGTICNQSPKGLARKILLDLT